MPSKSYERDSIAAWISSTDDELRALLIKNGTGFYLGNEKKRPAILHRLSEKSTDTYLQYKHHHHPQAKSYQNLPELNHNTPKAGPVLSGVLYKNPKHTWLSNLHWLIGVMRASRKFHVLCTRFDISTLYCGGRRGGNISAFGKELVCVFYSKMYTFNPQIKEKRLLDGTVIKYYELCPKNTNGEPKNIELEKFTAIEWHSLRILDYLKDGGLPVPQDGLEMASVFLKLKRFIRESSRHYTTGTRQKIQDETGKAFTTTCTLSKIYLILSGAEALEEKKHKMIRVCQSAIQKTPFFRDSRIHKLYTLIAHLSEDENHKIALYDYLVDSENK